MQTYFSSTTIPTLTQINQKDNQGWKSRLLLWCKNWKPSGKQTLSLTHPSTPTTNSPPRWGGNGWAQLNGNFTEVTKVTSPSEAKKCTRSPPLKTGDRAPPGSPRSPLGGRAGRRQPSQPGGDVPGEAGARSAATAGPRRLAGPSQAQPGSRGRGRRGRVLTLLARAGAARGLPMAQPRGPRRLRAAGGCGGSGGSEARPKLPFPDLAGPHLLESGNEHSLHSGDV